LSEKSGGLIILSGCCCDGFLVKNDEIDQDDIWDKWCKKFKKAEWYVELQPFEDEKEKWELLIYQAEKRGLPCLVTTDSHYPSPAEKDVQDFQLAINTSRPKSDPDRLKMEYPLWIPKVSELVKRCKAMGPLRGEWIIDTVAVGQSCHVELPKSEMIKLGGKISEIREKCLKRMEGL
jgi:DNA polymerase III alpha subunit